MDKHKGHEVIWEEPCKHCKYQEGYCFTCHEDLVRVFRPLYVYKWKHHGYKLVAKKGKCKFYPI